MLSAASDPFFRGVLYLILLVLGLAVGLFALLRLSRRYREHLLRKPSALDPQEWAEVKAHPVIGANLLSNMPMLERISPSRASWAQQAAEETRIEDTRRW